MSDNTTTANSISYFGPDGTKKTWLSVEIVTDRAGDLIEVDAFAMFKRSDGGLRPGVGIDLTPYEARTLALALLAQAGAGDDAEDVVAIHDGTGTIVNLRECMLVAVPSGSVCETREDVDRVALYVANGFSIADLLPELAAFSAEASR